MRKMSVLSLMLALALTAFAQPAAKGQLTEDLPNPAEIRPEDYRISRKDLQKALHILYGPGPENLVYPVVSAGGSGPFHALGHPQHDRRPAFLEHDQRL